MRINLAIFKVNKKDSGFTLIELLVVIAIIGLLATMSVVALNKSRARARDARRVADIKQIQTALEFYYNNHGYYPEFRSVTHCSVKNNNALASLVTDGVMSKVPLDPQFNEADPYRTCFNYLSVGQQSTYPNPSSLYCSNRPRTDFEWSLMFSTEAATFDLPRSGSTSYTYCLHGGLLSGL